MSKLTKKIGLIVSLLALPLVVNADMGGFAIIAAVSLWGKIITPIILVTLIIKNITIYTSKKDLIKSKYTYNYIYLFFLFITLAVLTATYAHTILGTSVPNKTRMIIGISSFGANLLGLLFIFIKPATNEPKNSLVSETEGLRKIMILMLAILALYPITKLILLFLG